MESLTRLVAESLARHGFDRPLDYRRLRWSRWFRCESHHSLLLVPSKPGVFALAEEIVEFDTNHSETVAPGYPAERSSATVEERRFSAASSERTGTAASAAEGRRMLAVTHFFEADDMAFVLDRMLARQNPLRDALNSGRYFIRFVVIEEESQRHSVHASLNQWIADATDKAAGLTSENASAIASHFAAGLELTPATEYVPAAAQASLFETPGAPSSVARTLPSTGSGRALSATAARGAASKGAGESNIKPPSIAAPTLDSGAATNIHCPSPFPSGF